MRHISESIIGRKGTYKESGAVWDMLSPLFDPHVKTTHDINHLVYIFTVPIKMHIKKTYTNVFNIMRDSIILFRNSAYLFPTAACAEKDYLYVLNEVNVNLNVIRDGRIAGSWTESIQRLEERNEVSSKLKKISRKLIDFVRDTARVPVIETGAGVVNTYFDKDGDLKMGRAIINNAKTRRVSVCNALDCLIIHESRLNDLFPLCETMAEKSVIIYADEQAFAPLYGKYPYLEHATTESYGTEFMDYKMAIKTVASLEEALDHIDKNGSGHSEAIVTMNEETARKFQAHVDAACVYWNAPTSFTDGAQFGLGAEIGISTQKLGPRGPMALEEICTYKWLIEGEGQIRS